MTFLRRDCYHHGDMCEVGFGATSPTLSDKVQYPYFLRTASPDTLQGLRPHAAPVTAASGLAIVDVSWLVADLEMQLDTFNDADKAWLSVVSRSK
eukprot:6461585-Amphidinium_carterae.1